MGTYLKPLERHRTTSRHENQLVYKILYPLASNSSKNKVPAGETAYTWYSLSSPCFVPSWSCVLFTQYRWALMLLKVNSIALAAVCGRRWLLCLLNVGSCGARLEKWIAFSLVLVPVLVQVFQMFVTSPSQNGSLFPQAPKANNGFSKRPNALISMSRSNSVFVALARSSVYEHEY